MLDALLDDGRLERVEPDETRSALALEEAGRHASSAEAIAATDPNGAYQLSYDAARKAVVAHLRRAGYRVRRGDGAHVITAEYAAAAIDERLGAQLEAMRRRRNWSEYGTAYFGENEVRDGITLARALIEAVAS